MPKIQFAYHFYFRNELTSKDTADRYLGQAIFTTTEDPPGPLVLESLVVQRILLEAILKEYFNGTPVFRLLAPDGSYITLDTALHFHKSRFQLALKAPVVSEGGAEPSALMNYSLQSQDQFQIAFASGGDAEILETQYDITGSQRALRATNGTDALVVIGALAAMVALFWLVAASGAKCGESTMYKPYTGPLNVLESGLSGGSRRQKASGAGWRWP